MGVTSAIKRANPDLVDIFLLHAIGWVLILVSVVLIAKPVLAGAVQRWGLRASGDPRDGIQSLGERRPWLLPLIGAVIGFMVGLTSVGSGTLVIVSLLFLYPRWDA